MTGPKKISIIGGSLWETACRSNVGDSIAQIRAMAPDTHFCIFTPHMLRDQSLTKDPNLEFHDSRPFALSRFLSSCLVSSY